MTNTEIMAVIAVALLPIALYATIVVITRRQMSKLTKQWHEVDDKLRSTGK